MPRIAPVTPIDVGDEPDAGTRVARTIGGILHHRPAVAEALREVSVALRTTGTLPRRLLELARLRIAFHNQCRSCMAIRYTDAVEAGLNEDLVCSLERPADAPDLTDAEKVAIRFGELFATNHLAIDDALFDELRVHFTEGQIMELAMNVSLFVGVGRLGAVLHMVDELPEAFRSDGGTLAPWGNESIIVT